MTPDPDFAILDPDEPNVVRDLDGLELLRPFNRCGVLAAADVHTAIRMCRLGGGADEQVALAVALAVRAPRVGHVSVDLADIRASAAEAGEELDFDLLPWPEPEEWVRRVAGCGLVDTAERGGDRPLKLVGTSLYLERHWRDEVSVADAITSRLEPDAPSSPAGGVPGGVADDLSGDLSGGVAGEVLERLFPGAGSRDQLRAAGLVLSRRFSVIAGGPGTGKTTTVARLLAALFEDAVGRGARLPLVGLAAPTGKAAARMEEAVRAEAARIDTGPQVRAALGAVSGSTIHRLLGTRLDRPGRFRHHSGHLLPHDVVVVDEASMVSLSLMASLAGAVRPEASLVLVGDPDQLVSVEAGAVLADIVGPAGRGTSGEGSEREPELERERELEPELELEREREPERERKRPADPPIAGSICILRRNHRFAGPLAHLSAAVRAGADDEVLEFLAGADPSLTWVDADPGDLLLGGGDLARSGHLNGAQGHLTGAQGHLNGAPGHLNGAPPGPLDGVRVSTVAWATEAHRLAASGDGAGALDVFGRHRILCAHRRGPAGVRAWNRMIQAWVSADIGGAGDTAAGADLFADGDDAGWYPGRPVMVVANDYALRLFNGDTGVTVAQEGSAAQLAGRLAVAFDRGRDEAPRLVSPTRLSAVETVYATTIHKSQGSEFDSVTILLPPAGSRLLTRELLYTGLTRARSAVTVVGTGEALRSAVRTPIARASGLGDRLWRAQPVPPGPPE